MTRKGEEESLHGVSKGRGAWKASSLCQWLLLCWLGCGEEDRFRMGAGCKEEKDEEDVPTGMSTESLPGHGFAKEQV